SGRGRRPLRCFPFSVRGPERGFRIVGRVEAAAVRPRGAPGRGDNTSHSGEDMVVPGPVRWGNSSAEGVQIMPTYLKEVLMDPFLNARSRRSRIDAIDAIYDGYRDLTKTNPGSEEGRGKRGDPSTYSASILDSRGAGLRGPGISALCPWGWANRGSRP